MRAVEYVRLSKICFIPPAHASGRRSGLGLEVHLSTELNNSRGIGRRKLSETTVLYASVNILELGMVEGVESLQPKLQPAALREAESLEERKVPVVAARSTQSVVAQVAKGSGCGKRKHRGVEVLDLLSTQHLMHI